MAPTDVPITKSGQAPLDNRTRNMPTWIAPRVPPPAKTNAVFGSVWIMQIECSRLMSRNEQGLPRFERQSETLEQSVEL